MNWMQQGGQQELLLIATLFQDTYKKNPKCIPFMKYIAEMIGAAIQIASSTKGGSGIWAMGGEVWPEKRVPECKHRRPVWSKGGNCIILCRKATKISQKQIKEDVSKHQRDCSTTWESFRGNEPEVANGKSLLCFPSVFRKTGFTTACILSSSSKERDVPCKRLAVCPAAGQAGCEGMAVGGCCGAAGALVFSLTPCSPAAQSVHLSSSGPNSSLGLCRKVAFSGNGKKCWFYQLLGRR